MEIKKIELDILKHFKTFCNENNIQYFLSNGTLLGAVKYKGFIPWDDDIDVFVPRKDYDRLMSSFIDNEQYKLFEISRNTSYRFPFAKMCDMSTCKIEGSYDNGIQLGLNIDIFPLDNWKQKSAKKQMRKSQAWMSCLTYSKIEFIKTPNLIKTILINLWISWWHFFGANRICLEIQKNATMCKAQESVEMGCIVWPIYGEREIIPKEVFSNTVEVLFEGEMFCAPIGYDRYLRSLYDDYEKEPPLEKQKTHHTFSAYRL